MTIIDQTAARGTSAVRTLREQKLRNGLPFMINLKELNSHECYLEYPNGTIKLVNVSSHNREIHVIRELNSNEAGLLRDRFNFLTVI